MSASVARAGAWAGVISVIAIFAYHMGLMALAGPRVSGIADVAAIKAYYSHTVIASAGLLPAFALLAMGVFVLALREALAPASRFLATLGLFFAASAIPLYIAAWSLEAGLVALAASGGDVVGFHRVWDVLYNSGAYVFEAGYIFSFGYATRAVPAFPRWLANWSILAAGLQVVNSLAIWVGIPDQATLFGNVAFAVWFVGCAVGLGRLAAAQAQPYRAAAQPA